MTSHGILHHLAAASSELQRAHVAATDRGDTALAIEVRRAAVRVQRAIAMLVREERVAS